MTIEYTVLNLNGNVESEMMFILDKNDSFKKLNIAYINKLGKIFFSYRDIKSQNWQRDISRLSPIHVIKTFSNNTDEIFKRINLN